MRKIIDIKKSLGMMNFLYNKKLNIEKEIIENILNRSDINIDKKNIDDIGSIVDICQCRGVYILFRYDDKFYIGSSKNVQKRILTHDKIKLDVIKNIKIFITDDFKELEAILINLLIKYPQILNKVVPIIGRDIRIIINSCGIKIIAIPEEYYSSTYFQTYEKYMCNRCNKLFRIDGIVDKEIDLYKSKEILLFAYKSIMKYKKSPETIWKTELFTDMDNDLDHLYINSISPLEIFGSLGNFICPKCGLMMNCQEIDVKRLRLEL
jgi:acetone carboxylase gamma subunit